jgi:spore coat protein CotH
MTPRTSRPLVAAIVVLVGCAVAVATLTAQSHVDSLLDGSSLQDLWVHINDRDWEDIHTHYQDNTYYPVDVEWQGTRVRNAGMRVRGDTSRNGHKPSFRIEFNRYVTGQTFFGLDALTLDSSWLDPSMITNRLSMLLFRQMGVPAPRVAHVRLFVGAGREYAGVYAATEEVSSSFLLAHFGEDTGYLYEYKHQTNDTWAFQDPGPQLGFYVPRFDAKNHQYDSVANLYMPIRDLVERINDAPASDLESALAGYLDVNSFITELAVQNFVAQTDGLVGSVGTNNFYLYRFAGKPFSVLIPWDQGNSFGWFDVPPWWNLDTNVLASKIWSEPKYRARYLAALLHLADMTSANGWLGAEVVREYQQIRDAVYADPFTPYSSDRFEQAHATIQEYVRARPDNVRQYVARLVASGLMTASRP